ncbi:hypothetical protein SNA_15230 [Streptomyces natalensis ATCC 27448]|uniref:DUF3307 domain-containing protein n=1 Tax=Streptomyces natalensis ATCC 27448 TaxID=1240678 RepID=A0A0D7CME9_9ACTN|nr:hypothetical protein SNA_15230 [Streptomyces natalensis ATCC 27448]
MLWVGHLLADYPGQTDHQAAHKAEASARGWRANLTHATTHVLVCGALLALGSAVLGWQLPPIHAAVAVAWIGATHSLIDRRWPIRWWMEHTGQRKFIAHGGMAHVDQSAHIAALTAAALYLAA